MYGASVKAWRVDGCPTYLSIARSNSHTRFGFMDKAMLRVWREGFAPLMRDQGVAAKRNAARRSGSEQRENSRRDLDGTTPRHLANVLQTSPDKSCEPVHFTIRISRTATGATNCTREPASVR
jgi:hypothetical protein